MHVKNKHTYQTIKSKTQQLDKKTKLSHERSIVDHYSFAYVRRHGDHPPGLELSG